MMSKRGGCLVRGLALMVWLGVIAASEAAVIQAGNVTGVTVTTNAGNNIWTASFALSGGGSAEITAYAPDVVRVNYHWAGPFDTAQPMIAKPLADWSATSATLSDQGSAYLIQTAQLDVEITKSPFKVHFKSKSGFYLLQDDFVERDADYNYTGQRGTGSSKLKNRKIFPANQAIFGLGEYGGPMNRRNREIDCWNSGTYNWGEFQNPVYMNIPFFYGVQPASGGNPAFVYGVFLNNPCRPLFKFGTESGDRYSFQAGDGRLDYFFFGGGSAHTMPKVIDRYSELTGRPTFLPKWGLGHHLSRFSYDNQSWVEYIANQATVSDIPLDAVYLDIDYMDADADGDFADGQLRQLTINSKFPTPSSMLSYCATRGVKVVPLIEPWLEPGDPLHAEANGSLHFIKDNGGATVTRNIYVGAVSWFDYSSTPMNTWWQGKIVNWFNTLAFAGIWNDLTEPEGGDMIPHNGLLWLDGQFGDQNDSRRWWSNERNYFGLRCSRQSYNAMLAKDANKRPFVLSRSGNAGLQRYAVSWSGDTRANWFYHRATIRFGMGAMIAGAAWYGNDVGGFAGTASPDLMVRSTEANCLTPFFRNHCDKSAADREPWRFAEPHQSMQRDLIKFRYRLMPYFYTLAYESTQTGEPMNVPPVFDYYGDANTHTELSDYDYLVGDYVLAAPVYAEGASSRQVYLPYKEGVHWYYWHNNARHEGGQTVNVSAPLGTLPLFVRSGAIIPMGPSMQYANQFQSPWMDINCWPEGTSEFTLFEDDGETWNYQGNGFSKRRMVSQRTAAYWDFTIEAKQGTYNTGARDFYVYCYNPGTNVVKGVRVNGAAIPQVANFDDGPTGWRITGEGRIGVKVPDNGALTAIRVSFADVEDSLQLAASAYAAAEHAGSVRVYVSRTGAATGGVSVAYATANGTATAGGDYTAANGVLNWSAGDTANKFFDVTLLDDTVYEGNETFTVQLSAPVGATLGSPSSATVTITENDPVPPALTITNPASETFTVAAATSNIAVQGLANALEWSGLRWTNSLTGGSGSLPAGFYWSVAGIPLGVGSNVITVTATNIGGPVAQDSGASAVYNDGWATNDNGGFGWGEWVIYTSSTNGNQNGRFMATDASVNIGTPAWGLYANSGNLSEAKRRLTNALAVGQTFSVSLDNGYLDPGAGAGVALQNSNGETLWELYFNGGQTNYVMNNNSITTAVDWTGGGLDVAFTLTSPTGFIVRITPVGGTTKTNAGPLISTSDQSVRLFRAWNFNAGGGSERDFFFNNLAISGGGGASTSDTVVVVRPAAIDSQIPQAWRDRYNLVGANSGDAEDKDGDGNSNWDEYVSDTNPTNPASFFGRVAMPLQMPGPGGVMTVMIQAPTTNSRQYGLSYSTNLMVGPWLPLGSLLSGQGDGGALMLVVTNGAAGERHIRARVVLP